ncbi:MAG: ArsA family ATPase, partial [Acidobacteria bacterium]|nr:ArsA family ATPase [Acidobacteriota bacterium]
MKSRKVEGVRESKRKAARKSSGQESELPSAHYLFFGGKGGVGKTTAASAAALHLLDRAQDDEQILLFSTDPAHSLSDSLLMNIGGRLTEVARCGQARLYAFEMNAERALEEFKQQHRATLQEIGERGTLLDESDINELLDLSLPGMDEVMSLFELSELSRAGAYARIIIDTAPSGHTSRLLRLPEVFTRMLGALDLMAEKHRYMVAQFVRGGRVREDEVDLFLNDLSERIGRVRGMLYDERQAAFTLVTIPEAMSVEESLRYYSLLRAEGVPVTDLIINRVEREHDGCSYCRARVAGQSKYLKQIAVEFKSLRLHQVPLLAEEVRGLDALRDFARLVWEAEEKFPAKAQGRKGAKADNELKLVSHASSPCGIEARRLLIFGGKGGVGKTTAAAAAALALAERDRAARVLVFSTDPAHSLSDSFGEEIGQLKRKVAGLLNLDAMEIDPVARFEELKERYRVWIDELFETLAGGSRWEVKFDREAMRELVALAPPGIDEIAALSAISDLLDKGGYTTIVLDTAPTGHLIRFLEMPQVALSWVRAFLKLLLKYKNVVRGGRVAEELIALSKNIKRVAALLSEASECEFVGVAIAETMSLNETIRLTETLARLKVPMRRLLINNAVPTEAATACEFCAARREAQGKVI